MRTCVHVAAALILAAIAASAESQFEVASVKQLDQTVRPGQNDLSFLNTNGKPIKITGNRVAMTGTLHALLAAAYDVKKYQIKNLPDWADSLLFAVVAQTSADAPPPTQDQIRPLFQTLLAERFQLKLHHETKELPVYHMTVSPTKKNNPLKAAAPGEKFNWDVSQTPAGAMRSKATAEPIADFIQLVTVSTDRPVIDKTGLTGLIDYEILVDQSNLRTTDDLNRAIVDAVKEQLGVKLEPAKDSVDMLAVDTVGKPSEN